MTEFLKECHKDPNSKFIKDYEFALGSLLKGITLAYESKASQRANKEIKNKKGEHNA